MELSDASKTTQSDTVTPKHFLNCDSTCNVKGTGTDSVALFITKLGSGVLRIGDEVLLSTQKSAAKRGEWIICDQIRCHSSQGCLVYPFNASNGYVNFNFNDSGCKGHILTISSKSQKVNETIQNNSKIVLQYSNLRGTEEWMGCDAESCRRMGCKQNDRTNLTNLRHVTPTITCDQKYEFKATFVL